MVENKNKYPDADINNLSNIPNSNIPNMFDDEDIKPKKITRFEAIIVSIGVMCVLIYMLFGDIDLDAAIPPKIIERSVYQRIYPQWDKYEYFKNQPNNLYYEKNLYNAEYREVCLNFYKLDNNDFIDNLGIDEKTQKRWRRLFILFKAHRTTIHLSTAYTVWRDNLYKQYKAHYYYGRLYSLHYLTFKKKTRVSDRIRKGKLQIDGIWYTRWRDVKVHEFFKETWRSKRIPNTQHLTPLQLLFYVNYYTHKKYGTFGIHMNRLYPTLIPNMLKKYTMPVVVYGFNIHQHPQVYDRLKKRSTRLRIEINIVMYNIIQTANFTPHDWYQLTAYSEEFLIYILLLEKKYPLT